MLRPTLRSRLLTMMLLLGVMLMAVQLLLFQFSEQYVYSELERYGRELSRAIQIGVEEANTAGLSMEKRLEGYLERLTGTGVTEISVISSSDRIVSSTNRENVGKKIGPEKKDLIFKAELGDTVSAGENAYNIVIPVVAGHTQLGYVHLAVDTGDFDLLLRRSLLRRLAASGVILLGGVAVAYVLASRYTSPIEEVAAAARAVAVGDLDRRLPEGRRDEIGDLSRSFNTMVGRLREDRELREKLRRAEHLAGIGQFSRQIAHEIKNPLNFISLSIDHMRESFSPPQDERRESFERLLSNVRKEINRLSRFAERFLEYGRPLSLDRRPCRLRALVDDTLDLAEPMAARSGVRIVREYGDLPEVEADADLLKTCLINLLRNSFQAMPSGGEITLRAGAAKGGVFIEETDSGEGVPPENLSRVFDPFFTTRDDGLGLGLPLVRRVVEEHGGKVSLRNREGGGACAVIHLPAKEA